MEQRRLRVLGKVSSINVRKVLWTCDEIGLAYDREDWGKGFAETQTPEFRALNPNAMVPVVVIGDYVLWESHAICRFLATLHGRDDLLPADPWRRAQVEKWLDWQAAELNPAWSYAFRALMRHDPDCTDPALIAASIARWNQHIAIIEQQLEKTGAYMAGDTFSLADIVIGLSLNRWAQTPMGTPMGTPIERPDFPAIARYRECLQERPACRAYGSDATP